MNQIVYEKILREPNQFVKIIYLDPKNNNNEVPKHWHRSIEVIYPKVGHFQLWLNGDVHLLKAGDIFVINSLDIHACSHGSNNYEGYAIQIDLNFIKLVYPQIESISINNDQIAKIKDEIVNILERMVTIQPSKTKYIEVNGYALVLLSLILKDSTPKNVQLKLHKSKYINKVLEVINYIDTNYMTKLSPQEIADKHNFSYGYLSRFFKETTGLTMSQYITHQRLEKTLDDIKFSSLSLTQIALNNGFSDYKSFDKMFSEQYKMKPSVYRKKMTG